MCRLDLNNQLEKGGASNPFRAPAVIRIRRRLACIGETIDGEGLAVFRAKLLNHSSFRKYLHSDIRAKNAQL